MKREPIDSGNITVRRSARLQNKTHVDPLVKIEDGEEQKTRLKRRLRHITTSATDGSNSTEETQEFDKVHNSLYCKTCNFTYESRKIYLTHQIQVHWDEIPRNYCSFCEHTFSSKHRHLIHLYNTHNINMHHMRKAKIRYHNMNPDVYDQNNFCRNCECTYTSIKEYHNHLKVKHGMDIPIKLKMRTSDIIPDIYDGNNFCNVCDYTFSSRASYRNHLFIFHSLYVPRKSRKLKVLYPDKKPMIFDPNNYCNACDRTYATPETYRYHLNQIHAIKAKCQLNHSSNRIPDIDDTSYFCNVCNHTYSTRGNYRKHMKRVHAVKVPLMRHTLVEIRYHNRTPDIDDPNNFCNMCDYTFSTKAWYLYHLRNTHAIKSPA